jgi:hypothetical protein
MVRGVVKDAAGKPVEGAKVSIDADANNRHFDTKSDKKGEFPDRPGAGRFRCRREDKGCLGAAAVTVRIAASSRSPSSSVAAGTAYREMAASRRR